MRGVESAAAVAFLALTVGVAAVAQESGSAPFNEDGYLPDGVLIEGETAVVVEVVDGDTIKVDRGKGVETVRYIGIDTPETVHPDEPDQPFGVDASRANEALVEGRLVILEKDISEVDRFDRLLRYVWVQTDDGVLLVNNELVKMGLADVFAYEPDTRYHDFLFRTLAEAKANGVGRWAAEPAAIDTPSTTPGLTPTVTPPPAPIDKSLAKYGKNLRYRWLDGREFECRSSYGCWGLLVKPTKACSKRLDVRLAVRDENGNWLETVDRSRKKVKEGKQVRFLLAVADADAYQAEIVRMRCLQTPKLKPKPKPRRNCDPSYPGVCIRPYPPDLDCDQVPYRRFAVRGRDPHGFDGDNDGIGCES